MLSKILAMLSQFFTIGIEPFCPMYSTTFSLPKNPKNSPFTYSLQPPQSTEMLKTLNALEKLLMLQRIFRTRYRA